MCRLQTLYVRNQLPQVIGGEVVWRHRRAVHAVANRLEQRPIARSVREIATHQRRCRASARSRPVTLRAAPVEQGTAGANGALGAVRAVNDRVRVA